MAGINWLQQQPELDMGRLGVAGFSQGGWVAPMAAKKSGHIKYILVSYGLAMSIAEEDYAETFEKLAAMGFTEKELGGGLKDLVDEVHDGVKNNFSKGWDGIQKQINQHQDKPWFEALKLTLTWSGVVAKMGVDEAQKAAPEMLKSFDPFYDPIPTLQQLNIPMFWLFGGQDIEAPPGKSINRLKKLQHHSNQKLKIKVYPDADHGMRLFKTVDNQRAYSNHPKSYMQDMVHWLTAQNQARIYSPGQQPATGVVDLVIDQVNVVSMTNDKTHLNQTVIIDKGVIKSIGPSKPNQTLNARKIILAKDKFLMPALHDMHTHLETQAFVKALGLQESYKTLPYEDLMVVYLLNGITTIQVMSGGVDLLEVRELINSGHMLGPKMIIATPMISGAPPILPEPFTQVINSDHQVETAIQHLAEMGYDFIKIRNNLTEPVFSELMRVAASLGFSVKGHVPRGEGLNLQQVLSSQKGFTMAHLEEFIYDDDSPDDNKVQGYIDLMLAQDVQVVTTLTVFDNIIDKMTDYEATLERDEVKYVHPLFKTLWLNNPFKQQNTMKRLQQIQSQLGVQKRLAKAFYHAGVPIMVGTDALNPTIVPGFSIHRELELLRDAGLNNHEILRMATVIPAKSINPHNNGSIAVDQSTDMLLLNENPLENLATLKKPVGLVLGGQFIARTTLDQRQPN